MNNNNNKHLDELHMHKHAIIAKASNDVYHHGINEAEKNLKMYLPNHTIDKKISSKNATIIKDTQNPNVYISYRPTDPLNINDLAVDALEIAANLPISNGRFTEAQNKYEEVKKVYPNSKIVTTGHSLGGSEAVYVGRKNNIDSVAYNIGSSPTQLPTELNATIKHNKPATIYHTFADPISVSNAFIDTNDNIITLSPKYLNLHSLSNFLPNEIINLETIKNNWISYNHLIDNKNLLNPIFEKYKYDSEYLDFTKKYKNKIFLNINNE